MFVQENIEKLKRHWTDKYVVVEGNRPELRRFDGYTGQVKTVNMSGRALVQFDAWSNIGWYDIECGYLTEVPKPEAGAGRKVTENDKAAAPTKVPAPGVKPAAKETAGKPAAAKPAAAKAGGKMSVAEMLAAARANKPAGEAAAKPAAAPTEAKAAPKPPAAKPQAAKAPSGGTVVLEKGQRPTVAQMLAYCREHDAQG